MKSVKKIMVVLVICILMIVLMSNFIEVSGYDWETKISDMNNASSNDTLNGSVRTVVVSIISVTRTIAVGVAIIMLTVLAMKYMMSAPGDRADIKKHAVVYVVGAVVLFASSGILTIIAQFAENI